MAETMMLRNREFGDEPVFLQKLWDWWTGIVVVCGMLTASGLILLAGYGVYRIVRVVL